MKLELNLTQKKLSYDAKAKLAFLAVVAIFVVIFMNMGLSLGSAALQKKEELGRLHQLIKNSDQAKNRDEDPNLEKLFEGDNLAEIQSKLQGRIKQIGDRYAIAIDSVQALDPLQENVFLISRIRLNGSIPEENFVPFLVEMATVSPSVFVSDMDIRLARVRTARTVSANEQIPKLSIQLVLSGLSKYNSDF